MKGSGSFCDGLELCKAKALGLPLSIGEQPDLRDCSVLLEKLVQSLLAAFQSRLIFATAFSKDKIDGSLVKHGNQAGKVRPFFHQVISYPVMVDLVN